MAAGRAGPRPGRADVLAPARPAHGWPAGIAFGTLLVLAVANAGIWQKEELIAHGQPLYVAIRPVDPRSLMQGDYMQLDFAIPDETTDNDSPAAFPPQRRPQLVARRDARDIASLLRWHGGEPLKAGEFLLELSRKHGRWVLGSDAWFFKEGEAARWADAKYGEFRVLGDGRTMLVGLRGPDLEKL